MANKISYSKMFKESIFTNNPVFIQLLGMCPVLAVTDTFEKGLGMGLLVIMVLTLSNLTVSLLKNFIDPAVKIPAFIVIIASFVTMVGMFSEAFLPELYDNLGLFIPLIVVNCLVLGRAEAFASKNRVVDSVVDGIAMGIGFTVALVVIGITRELLATGEIIIGSTLPIVSEPKAIISLGFMETYGLNMELFGYPSGAFLVLGLYIAFFAAISNYRADKKAEIAKQEAALKRKQAAEAAAKKKAELAKEGA